MQSRWASGLLIVISVTVGFFSLFPTWTAVRKLLELSFRRGVRLLGGGRIFLAKKEIW